MSEAAVAPSRSMPAGRTTGVGSGWRKTTRDVRILLFRSVREGVRNPAFAFLFPTVFPLFIILLTSQSFRDVVNLPGFPNIRPYAAYEAPAVLLLTAMMGAGYSATGLVVDAQTGFLDRLRMLPVRPVAILLGRLLFDAVRTVPAFLVVLLVSFTLDARLDSGLAGAAFLLGLTVFWALAYNGLFFVVALRTQNAQAPLAVVPLFMPMMFMSTAYVPRGNLPRWLQVVSDWNPYTHLLEGARVFMTSTPTWTPVWKALVAAAVILVVTQAFTIRAFRALVRGD
ncbi:MAG: ABC transporter permease [Actinomycetota bacterium]